MLLIRNCEIQKELALQFVSNEGKKTCQVKILCLAKLPFRKIRVKRHSQM